jgi:hypothetical protein
MQKHEKPIFHYFLGRSVVIELEDCVFYGKLLHYQFGSKGKLHKPTILIVESPIGKVIIRGNWISIAEGIKE